ncbi:citrate synthase [Prevotella sp. 10(H)]|uniref:citrate synthase n=1 Tax=Prevotella sp. 10(H) TaxID=1158294 RepID=UPI0004A71ED4|nr:citrate synthase [Prevotella sp. 10(H)]
MDRLLGKRIVDKISGTVCTTSNFDPEQFKKMGVKRGLRNEDHTGVIVGLTKVGDVVGYERGEDGKLTPIPGKLLYRGISLEDIVKGAQKENRLGFEEVVYLILSGNLPTKEELSDFSELMSCIMDLKPKIVMHILDLVGNDIMNYLSRCVLELYTFDEKPDDISPDNLIKQSLNLIATFPTIIAYAHNALRHSCGKSLHIRHPQPNLSLAENFLYMMKGHHYTPLDVKILDLALMVHADHGGGNNSTFTVRVTSSAGTDTYSAIAAGIGSLKGPLHGGANLKVIDMMKNIKANVKNWTSVEEVDRYLLKILNKEAYDKSGLIYGIGHAIYTISDPRTMLLKEMAHDLAVEKGREAEYNFYRLLEERAILNFMEMKGKNVNKQVCANVDFYSGFIYDMIGLPQEIYTPLFAMARIVGWCAHRIEELNFRQKRIIRPAYKNAAELKEYKPINERE